MIGACAEIVMLSVAFDPLHAPLTMLLLPPCERIVLLELMTSALARDYGVARIRRIGSTTPGASSEPEMW